MDCGWGNLPRGHDALPHDDERAPTDQSPDQMPAFESEVRSRQNGDGPAGYLAKRHRILTAFGEKSSLQRPNRVLSSPKAS